MKKHANNAVRSGVKRIAPSLEESGIAQTIVSNAAANAKSCSNPKRKEHFEAIGIEWQKELERLRKSCVSEHETESKAVARATGRLQAELNDGRYNDDVSKSLLVFRYFVALGSKCRISRKLGHLALEEYARRQSSYDRLLGSAVPKSVRNNIARAKFFNNENATVLSDERAHWKLLRSKNVSLRGLPTTIPSVDAKIGGFAGLTLLAAPPGAGKTSLAIDLTARMLSGMPELCVLFIELEDSKVNILNKFLSRESEISFRTIVSPEARTPKVDDTLRQARKRLKKSIYPRLQIIDRMSAGCPAILAPQQLNYLVKRLLKKTRTAQCLVVLDSFDRTVPANVTRMDKHGHAEEYEITEDQSDRARLDVLLAAQRRTRSQGSPNGFPFLVITRTRKALTDDRPLILADVYGSIDIVYEMHAVLLLQQETRQNSTGVVSVLLDVAKVRDIGERGVIPLDFHHPITKFTVPTNQAADASKQPSKIAAASLRGAGRK